MTQVNLLPPEVKGRQKVRRITMAAVGGVCAVIVILLAVFVIQNTRLSQANQQLAAEQVLNAGLNSKIARLTKYEELHNSVAARQALVDGLLHQQILWSDVLTDMSSVMPDDLWLTTMNGTLSTDTSGTLVGSIALEGKALGFRDVAALLDRLELVKGWVNAWTTSVSKTDIEGTSGVQFTASVDLGSAAAINGRAK